MSEPKEWWVNCDSHSHRRVGIWDSDNGDKAGTVCELCMRWNEYPQAQDEIAKLRAALEKIVTEDHAFRCEQIATAALKREWEKIHTKYLQSRINSQADELATCQKQLETMKAENAELNNELKFIQTLRGQDEQIQILKSALKYATEIIHDEFCGKECHPIHKELKALADMRKGEGK